MSDPFRYGSGDPYSDTWSEWLATAVGLVLILAGVAATAVVVAWVLRLVS